MTRSSNDTSSSALKENLANVDTETETSPRKPFNASPSKKRKSQNDNNISWINQKNWEQLYHELAEERITKPEQLFYAYRRESEERENLMREYNQELEQENRDLKSQLADHSQQEKNSERLQKEVNDLRAAVFHQKATIQAFKQMTGTTLSNVQVTGDDTNCIPIGYDCTTENQHSKTKTHTKFRISVVENGTVSSTMDIHNASSAPPPPPPTTTTTTTTLLKYQPLENPESLPEFLHEEIEFESTELPPLLQNVLRGIFPED